MQNQVVIVGAGYAGLTAALELRKLLPEKDKVTVVSANDTFVFYPSLIWVVQGERELADISFPLRPVFEEAGVEFIHAPLARIEAENQQLMLYTGQTVEYDKLLITTGGEWDWEAVPGLQPKPQGHTISMLSPQAAVAARPEWQALMADPGPIVIGATLNASLYGAAYEFALNLGIALRKEGLDEKASITFVTPEPFLGHFGHGGLGNSREIIEDAFQKQRIGSVTEAQISKVEADRVFLGGSRFVNAKLTMLVPPYKGIEPVRQVPDLTDEAGRIPVDDFYRSPNYADIFAAGIATQIKPTVQTLLPCGVLVTGTVSAEMGRGAAHNIAATLGYEKPQPRPADIFKSFYVLDTGSHGLFMSLGSQSWLNFQLNIPGPWSHWAKQITEEYQMWQLQTGRY